MAEAKWTFLSNHGHVLVALSRDPKVRVRDLVELVGITERSVRAIIADLKAAGYIKVVKNGRQNEYRLLESKNLRHPAEDQIQVRELLAIFKEERAVSTKRK